MGKKFLVMGCGGIGGTVAAHLAEMGAEVHAVSRNPAVVEAVRNNGFRLVGEGGRRSVPGRIHGAVPADEGPFDFVLLATQPTDVEEAARQAAPVLAEDGRMVCFQNGLCEARVAELLGAPERVVGGIVAWGALMVEPGVFDKTSSGGFVLGRYDGGSDPSLLGLATLLEPIGPVEVADNLAGARWSKLALNCAVSSMGTLNGSTLGKVVRNRNARRLALEIMSEAVEVAQREGVELEKVSGTLDLEWMALTGGERQAPASVGLASKHAMVLAVGLRYRRLRSSMLRAIEAGKPPAVDFLNGEIVDRGARYEVPTPVNDAVRDAVWAIYRGDLPAGPQAVAQVYEATRA